MIHLALHILKRELEHYFQKQAEDGTAELTLTNVSLLDSEQRTQLNDKILISLVNLEEESSLKNQPNLLQLANGTRYVNPPIFLNLYLLFCVNPSLGNNNNIIVNNYLQALRRLSTIVQFFQSRNTFSLGNASNAFPLEFNLDSELRQFPGVSDINLRTELYTLTFEQINHLWGSLGGKQIPFVMYKVRLVSIQDPSILAPVPPIEEVNNNAILE